jgi:CIC family chloride channel protein
MEAMGLAGPIDLAGVHARVLPRDGSLIQPAPVLKRYRLAQFVARFPNPTRGILLTCLYALGAGLVTVLFQVAIHGFYDATFERFGRMETFRMALWSFAVIVPTSLLSGWLMFRFCPEAAGSGIPQLKASFWKDFGAIPSRVAWVKFIAGILSIGGGTSLGREGPSVQLAGAVGSNLAGFAGEPRHQRRMGAATGAAAGLAAAFNTPLAAITFVLEEIIGDLNSRLLGFVLLASVIGAFVVHALIGKQPAFILTDVSAPTFLGYLLTPVVAAVSAAIGVLFQKSALGLRAGMRRTPVPNWLRPVLGALLTWALGVAVFSQTGRLGVFSLGYQDLSEALRGDLSLRVVVLLLATKFIATVACYGTGGCGGIFSPSLFLGAMGGAAVVGMIQWVVPVERADLIALMVVGMSATLGAVVRAPVTGILIVFEMTHEFALVPALMIGALISQLISRMILPHNFYEAALRQDDIILERIVPPRDLSGWQSLPVSMVTNFQPVVLTSIEPETIRSVLNQHRFARFPVVLDEGLAGYVDRGELRTALAQGRDPTLSAPASCLVYQSIRELQRALIESPNGMVAVLDRPRGRVLGIVTLHDLLRAEVAAARNTES